MPMNRSTLALAACLLTVAACGGSSEPPPLAVSTPGGSASAAPASPGGPGMLSPHAGVGEMAPTPEGRTVAAAGFVFDLPERWVRQAPTSSMRIAQAEIPGEKGAALLSIFHFGEGGGGGVEANLDRWIGQVEVAPGVEPERGAFEVGDYRVTWIDVSGTLVPTGMGGPDQPEPNSKLVGAVVEGAGGPWFFKAMGPAETLTGARDEFLAMLRSVRAPAPGDADPRT
ncbi:MAG: hypothetical protein KDB94_00870 [Acidobacteria bacterium]|nr:hypothetical protein [Acidobacteriota bacterium]